ncbi:hypothetical protein D3C84_643870 [compost metagenome]
MENQIKRADHVAVFFIGEPHVQKGFVGPFIEHSLSIIEQSVIRCRLLLIVVQHDLPHLTAIELALPGFTTVIAVQHNAVVPDHPALRRARELHGHQVGTHWYFCLAPADATIIGIKNVTALAHGNQTLTRTGQPCEHPVNGFFAWSRRT